METMPVTLGAAGDRRFSIPDQLVTAGRVRRLEEARVAHGVAFAPAADPPLTVLVVGGRTIA
jgi:hypothetical protein